MLEYSTLRDIEINWNWAYTWSENSIAGRCIGGGIAFHNERVCLRAANASNPCRCCDGAAVVVRCHHDG